MTCATKQLNRYFEDLFAECGAILNHYHAGLYTPTEAVGELLDKLSAAKEVCVRSDHLRTAKADVVIALEEAAQAVAQDIATPTRPSDCQCFGECECGWREQEAAETEALMAAGKLREAEREIKDRGDGQCGCGLCQVR